MKNSLLFISFTLLIGNVFGQNLNDDWYYLTFEDPSIINHLRIDPASNHNNLWQVGSPQKTILSSAYSFPSAIITDTTNTYPVNDTSSFEIVNLASSDGWIIPHTVILEGYYYVNSDSLTDFGTIEISPDNGITWIDLVNDTAFNSLYLWDSPKPVLTGNSNAWQWFRVWLAALGPAFNVQYNDTILYRFTFYSDSIQTNKDGLMFDDFHFEDYAEDIPEIQNDNLISVYPNPASNEIQIHKNKSNEAAKIQVLNYTGQILIEDNPFDEQLLNTSKWGNGIYFLKYSDSKGFCIKKIVIQH